LLGCGTDRAADDRACERRSGAMVRTADDGTEERAGNDAGCGARSRRRAADDVHLLLRWHTRRTRVEARLLRRPDAAVIVIAVLLLRGLPTRRISVNIRVDLRGRLRLIDHPCRRWRWWRGSLLGGRRRGTASQHRKPCQRQEGATD